jgi:hypothetical protein
MIPHDHYIDLEFGKVDVLCFTIARKLILHLGSTFWCYFVRAYIKEMRAKKVYRIRKEIK